MIRTLSSRRFPMVFLFTAVCFFVVPASFSLLSFCLLLSPASFSPLSASVFFFFLLLSTSFFFLLLSSFCFFLFVSLPLCSSSLPSPLFLVLYCRSFPLCFLFLPSPFPTLRSLSCSLFRPSFSPFLLLYASFCFSLIISFPSLFSPRLSPARLLCCSLLRSFPLLSRCSFLVVVLCLFLSHL
jgi:hypothetical protein